MKLSSANPTIINFNPYQTSTVQRSDLGTIFETSDFRKFRYALSGTGALTTGNVGTEPAAIANHLGINPSVAAPLGATTVSVTIGSTAAAANEYNEGFLVVSGAPGNGQVLKISSNPAIASGGTGTITLDDPLAVALTTASIVNLVHNEANGTIEGTTQTRKSVGVPLTSVAAGNYYFGQSRGLAAVAADAATAAAVGSALVLSGTVSGAVTASSSTFSSVIPVVAVNTLTASVASKNFPVFLTID